MTRRRRGLLVIGAAAVLVIVLSGVLPRTVAGTARSAPVAGVPAVGDCVTEAVTQPAPSNAAWPSTGLDYPRAQIGACTGVRYGEVVTVTGTPRVPVMAGDAADRYVDDPNLDTCYQSTQAYIGLSPSIFPAPWTPLLRITSAMSAPSLRQQAAGQHWAACVVGVTAVDGTGGSPAGRSYHGSIRHAMSTGSERNELGSCRASVGWQDDSFVDCAQRHRLELFALGSTTNSSGSQAQLQRTCEELVRRLTAMPDPTAGGALAVVVHVGQATGDQSAERLPENLSLQCGVAAGGSRLLGGSLLALGREPVPWG